MKVIDSHAHFGEGYRIDEYLNQIKGSSVRGVIAFPLAGEIYRRADKNFEDSDEWKRSREKANRYCLNLARQTRGIQIYPFKFMWNDFNRKEINKYFGVKWQRRDVDPEYEMGSSKFLKLLGSLRNNGMPIVFEDEAENIITFLKKYSDGINVIVPHLGFGGKNYGTLKDAGVWSMENVYTDTSYAMDSSTEVIKQHIESFGHERILFGSDYPFFNPREEIEAILGLGFNKEVIGAISRKNALRLLAKK